MQRTCPHCKTKNRVPATHLHREGKCGKCKQSLPPVSSPIEADSTVFNEIINGSPVPILVDFWASWCGPCKMAAPEIAKAANELAGKALVLKVNTESQQQLAALYSIRSIPNFKIWLDGKIVWDQAGLLNSQQLVHQINRFL